MASVEETVIAASSYEHRTVSLEKLSIDRRVQRDEPDPKRINKMVAEFDPDGLGTLTASQRPNGEIVILDGQHRLEACKLTGLVDELDCKVFTDLWVEGPEVGLRAEARIFIITNRHIKVNSVDTFRVAVTEGNEEALRLMQILNHRKLTPRLGTTPGSFYAIATAIRIARGVDGYDLLNQALKILQDAWPDNRMSMDGRLLEGLVAFIRRYKDEARLDRLENNMRMMGDEGPKEVLKTAHNIRTTLESGPIKYAVAKALARVYNKGLQDRNKLSSWRVDPPTEVTA